MKTRIIIAYAAVYNGPIDKYKNKYVGIWNMGATLNDGKVLGLSGILAVVVYLITLFASAFTTSGFEIGINNITELGKSTIYVAGCIIAGILGLVYGAGLFIRNKDEAVIAKIYSIVILAAAAILTALGASGMNGTILLAFEMMVVISLVCEVAFNWVSDQKILMIISIIFFILVAASAVSDLIMGFAFAIFVAVWVVLSAMFYVLDDAHAMEAKPVDKEPRKEDKKEDRNKNPAKHPQEVKKIAPVEQASVAVPVKKEAPKKIQPAKEMIKPALKVQPKPVEKKAEELPKLKVMSSRDAAVARDKKREERIVPIDDGRANVPEPVKEESAKVEPSSESVEAKCVQESVVESSNNEEPVEIGPGEEEMDEGYEVIEDTPDALVRRAAWNKGLRCRRDYGEHKIPVAFVKGKVAVYVVPEIGDLSIDDVLRSEGWTVFRYLESDITDGKDQGDEIAKAVKENIRAERVATKKKKKVKN